MPPLVPVDLTCEQRRDPLGIDATSPRLGWALEGGGRGAAQKAWQVRVGRTPGGSELWDSGRVAGDAQIGIAYAGSALASRSRYHWQVRVWDAAGNEGPWSAAAWFETAFLDPAEFSAGWIGATAASVAERGALAPAAWLRAQGQEGARQLALRRTCELPADAAIVQGRLVYWMDGRSEPWRWGRAHISVNGVVREPWRSLGGLTGPGEWDVTAQLRPGANELALRSWLGEGTACIANLVVLLADGRTLEFPTGAPGWSVRVFAGEDDDPRWCDPAAPGWGDPVAVGSFGSGPWPAEDIRNRCDHLIPPCILERRFTVRPGLVRARLYATACGVYTAAINGGAVGDRWLAPGCTAYHKRLHYQTYDVTAQLRTGGNVLSATVADGWYSGQIFIGAHAWGVDKALRAQLHLDYEDGSGDVIASGPDGWLAGTGPVRFAELFHGQHEDRRVAPSLRPAAPLRPAHGALQAQPDEPVRAFLELPVRALVEQAPGVWIADFGQNLAGVVRLRVRALRGTRVRLRFGEILNPDGSLYTDNLRTARSTDVLVCAGGGEEVFEPRLTFHGFRYCEVSGLPEAPLTGHLTAIAISSDLADAGGFCCDDPLLDRLQENIRWGWRCNSVAIPTDCPQRDERAGWTGDAQIFVRTAQSNTAGLPFWAKYQQDMVDAQHASGSMPDFAPCHTAPELAHYGWGDAAVVVPWTSWRTGGDTAIIDRHWQAMRRYLDHRDARSPDERSVDWSFGDWVSPKPQTPNEVLGPVYHAWMHRLMAEMADGTGRGGDAEHHRRRFAAVAAAWRARFLSPDGRIHGSDTQAAYACALRAGLIPDGLVQAAGAHLVAAIERAGWHLATGFLGTGNLLPALSLAGRDDVAWRLLRTESAPGWLYTVKNGATTMWELWDGYDPLRGATSSGMNSFNHYAFGAVGDWMYAAIGGLAQAPGDIAGRSLVIAPTPGGLCRRASCWWRGPRGRAAVRWWIADGTLELRASLPPGCTAEVRLPTRAGGGAVRHDGASHLRDAPDRAVFAIGAGDWSFSAPA